MRAKGIGFWLAVMLVVVCCYACSDDKDQQAAQTPTKLGPRLRVEETSFDFGKIAAHAKLQHDFILANTGDEDLQMPRANRTGSCIAESKWAGKRIAPGSALTLPVYFSAGSAEGKHECTIAAEFNDPTHQQVDFVLTATTEAAVEFKPAEIRAFRVDPTQGVQVTLMISNVQSTPLTITSITAQDSSVAVEFPLGVTLPFRLGPGEKTSVTVAIRGLGSSRIETSVVVELAEYPGSKIEVPLVATRRN